MKTLLPGMHGLIDRRMLINFRVQPDVIRPLLPAFFRPKLINGWALAGLCLIRLKAIRPHGFPAFCGLASENAAHRIAVEWDQSGQVREGVYVPRRDTSSILQAVTGGRIFPGVNHVADFAVKENDNHFALEMHSHDGAAWINLAARRTGHLPATSVFPSLSAASDFFARGAIGYSATHDPRCCDGLELHTNAWHVHPLEVLTVQSSFFDDPRLFPAGTIHFDCALLMENLEHHWRALARLEGKL